MTSPVFDESSKHRLLRWGARAERRLRFRNQWFIHVDRCGDNPLGPVRSCGFDLVSPADRFWADPFLHVTANRLFVFVEELEFAGNKGRISVLECDFEGRVLDHRTVLEEPWHLSYPFVFEWNGQLWMLPESGASGMVTVYCCERFPDRWVKAGTVLDGVRSADPTLFEHGGVWWLFASIEGRRGGLNTDLHLFSSTSPLGGFRPHPRNPVYTSKVGARPAGPLFEWHGDWYRPAQDCEFVYGKRVVIKRVLSLDEAGYAEEPAGSIEPGWRPEIARTHTLCVRDGWRALDALRFVPR